MRTFLSFQKAKKTGRPLFLIIMCLVLFSIHSKAQAPFITSWQTTSTNETITIPTNSSYTYNYDIDWENDGTFDDFGVTGNIIHTYPTAGTRQIAIRGIFPAIYINNNADRTKIISIDQWGDIEWQSMEKAFWGASNLAYTATDSPDLTNVIDMSAMFYDASIFNGNLSNWNVSNVTNMEDMFRNADAFNGDISTWDMGSVSNMYSMFSGAESFNGDLSDWDVSSAIDMGSMFTSASAFNSNISTWPVGSVTNMSYMFSNATSFNSNLTNWYIADVTNMSFMFNNATSFNGDVSNWELGSVTNMSYMFNNATSFDGDVSNWNVGSVTNMSFMFSNADSFNGDLNNWDVTAVINMQNMFFNADVFSGGNMTNWETDELTNMKSMFQNANSFNGNISTWNVSNVTTMEDLFRNASSFNGDLSDWDVSNVENMDNMLDNCSMSITNYDNMLIGWAALPSLYFQVDLGAAGLNYCNGSSARNLIENNYGWFFSGDALNCSPDCFPPNNANVEVTNPTTAVFTWDEDPEATFYQVKYRLKGTTAWLTAGSSNPQRTISNLAAKKYYQYKVRAECLAGNWSDFSDIQLFYTSTCDVPTGVASIYLDNSRMRIRWDNDPNEIKAKVRYREVGTSTWYTQNSQPGQNFMYINGLTPNATYQYRVRSNCDGNDWSAYTGSYFHDLSSPPARLEQEETALSETKFYPNPAKEVLNIEFQTQDAEDINITITNSLGEMILTTNNTYNEGIQKESIHINQLPKGYYFITIRSGKRIETQQFLKLE